MFVNISASALHKVYASYEMFAEDRSMKALNLMGKSAQNEVLTFANKWTTPGENIAELLESCWDICDKGILQVISTKSSDTLGRMQAADLMRLLHSCAAVDLSVIKKLMEEITSLDDL